MTKQEMQETIKRGPYQIKFPTLSDLDQDEEWCEVVLENQWKKIRFHDYEDIYEVPGLYETLFYRTLKCCSPTEVMALFRSVIQEREIDPGKLRVMDFGAGNGLAGEALQSIGVRRIIGVDIIPQAMMAAERDRPWVYDDYYVDDMASLDDDTRKAIRGHKPNALVTVAALGYGDIPVPAFFEAFNSIETPGWIAMNIKEDFVRSSSREEFAGLMNRMYEEEILQTEVYKRYCHRLTISGKKLYYVALVGKKLRDIPVEFIT